MPGLMGLFLASFSEGAQRAIGVRSDENAVRRIPHHSIVTCHPYGIIWMPMLRRW